MKINSFINELKKINIDCSEECVKKLDIYYEYLIEYNSHTNVTAITEKEEVYLKHFYDSLSVCTVFDFNKIDSLIDIGSGAGFPGVVLKIFFPHLNVTVLDSNNKKTTFISNLVEKLELEDIKVINSRAEDYAKDNLNTFDLCISRAVAYVDVITELSLPFIKESGKVVLMKGNFDNELITLTKFQKELNISKYTIEKFYLPNKDERNFIILEKKGKTTKVMGYSQIIKRSRKWNNK